MHVYGIGKRFQKRSFDLLSQRYGSLAVLISLVIVMVAVIQFGETLVHWSTEKYAAVFNSFSDNLVSRSFRNRLCLPVPIDIVYTWVNGSDPVLLEQLREYRRSLTNKFETSSDNSTISKCEFESCVAADGVVIDPPIPRGINLQQFATLYPSFSGARELRASNDPATGHNVSIVLFDNVDVAETAVSSTVVVNGQLASVRRLYYTTDKTLNNALPTDDIIIMTGFPDVQNKENLLESLPSNYRNHITNVLLYQDRGIAVLMVADSNTISVILTAKNITISGKSPTFSTARLVWDLTDYRKYEDISASRFEDNEELRYSLRSVERHAPWIRHVFIVTNGQIPAWLNLDYERVSIVTHAELFSNVSHLPTFSSPAIESHLHRIPGLSDRFIYMNDDVMFGRDVWPDDFVSPSGTQKIYLTYPVPNCREGCPSSWISDGYCDRACNNSQCEWDGGDCASGRSLAQYPNIYGGGIGQSGSISRASDLYCNSGCANNWIADRYCDQSCNVLACAFDAGDCGTDNFHLLHRINLQLDDESYDARGYSMFYFNLSSVLGETGHVAGGLVAQNDIVRSASIGRKFKVATVLLHVNHTARELGFTFSLKTSSGNNVTLNVTVLVDTRHLKSATPELLNLTTESPDQATTSDMDSLNAADLFGFENQTLVRFPRPKFVAEKYEEDYLREGDSLLEYDLPMELQSEYRHLLEQLNERDITQAGFQLLKLSVWRRYVRLLEKEGKKPVRLEKLQSEPSVQTSINIVMTESNRSTDKNTSRYQFKNFIDTMIKSDQDVAAVTRASRVPIASRVGRKLQSLDHDVERTTSAESESLDRNAGFLPWEKKGTFSDLERLMQSSAFDPYAVDGKASRRRLLDTYADSLRHVSRVYNRAYGYTARRVPAHMPHMIDRRIMTDLQARFPVEWQETSSHRIRQADDMQYAFSYFYFLISESVNVSIDDAFDELDIDQSGVLSDRELRILATRVYDLPLDLKSLEGLERILMNCSNNQTATDRATGSGHHHEVYFEKRLPQVTRALLTGCEPIVLLLTKNTKSRLRHRHEVVSGDDVVYFKMLRANLSQVIAVLDELRHDMRKFICLNDNIDYAAESSKSVKVVLKDFYESFLPTASRFELPRQYRNRFVHVGDLHQWWYYRKWLRWSAQSVLIAAVAFAVLSFCSDRFSLFKRRWWIRR